MREGLKELELISLFPNLRITDLFTSCLFHISKPSFASSRNKI